MRDLIIFLVVFIDFFGIDHEYVCLAMNDNRFYTSVHFSNKWIGVLEKAECNNLKDFFLKFEL